MNNFQEICKPTIPIRQNIFTGNWYLNRESKMIPYFIDIEASSLSWNSYPIEVAWGNEKGNIESHLISPKTISHWTDWDPKAQQLHGINRKELLSQGKNPERVCERIAQCLTGREVYSDNPDFDAMWLSQLFDACNRRYPSIDLRHLDTLLISTYVPNPSNRISGLRDILTLKARARQTAPGIHRAAHDVQYLIKVWRLTQNT
jgi:hypothetical protein